MDFEEIHIPYGRENEHITCWMHPVLHSRTLVFLIHGHNSRADTPRLQVLASRLQRAGLNVCRFNVLREQVGDYASLVTTVEEEVRQATVALEAMREEFDTIIVAGHSQGGIVALQLALDNALDGVVFLMSVMDPQHNVEGKLQRLGVDLEELHRKKHTSVDLPDGRVMTYTPAFFEDLQLYDMHGMLTQWYGPSLFVTAANDESILQDESEHGFAMANEPKELFVVEDKHQFSTATAEAIADKIAAWIKGHGLQGEPDADPY